MTRRGEDPALVVLAERIGLSVDQVKTGIELARSGRVDVLSRVIAGELTAAEAITAIRRRTDRGA